MERGIEAQHLRDLRMPCACDGVDGSEFLWHVQRGEMDDSLEILADLGRQEDRLKVVRPSMHDAMADGLRRGHTLRSVVGEEGVGVDALESAGIQQARRGGLTAFEYGILDGRRSDVGRRG